MLAVNIFLIKSSTALRHCFDGILTLRALRTSKMQLETADFAHGAPPGDHAKA